MNRALLGAAIVGGTLLILAGLAYNTGSASETQAQTILKGELTHDFGVITLMSAEQSQQEHTFRLTNETRRPLQITQAVVSCGCAQAQYPTEPIQPGESFEVSVSIVLDSSGRRYETVALIQDEYLIGTLTILAEGRRVRTLRVLPEVVTIDFAGSDDVKQVTLEFADYLNDEQPAAPMLQSPEGMRATFLGWERVRHLDTAGAFPARWSGVVEIGVKSTAERERWRDQALVVSVNDESREIRVFVP